MLLLFMSFRRILLCVDGEAHSTKAVALALDLAECHGATLDGLYVVDPFLKKFTDEIYAINREECRAHLDRSLRAEGDAALAQLAEAAASRRLIVGQRLEYGPPEEVIPRLAHAGEYDVVIVGGKRFANRYQRWTSRDLPRRLDGKLDRPLLIVRV